MSAVAVMIVGEESVCGSCALIGVDDTVGDVTRRGGEKETGRGVERRDVDDDGGRRDDDVIGDDVNMGM